MTQPLHKSDESFSHVEGTAITVFNTDITALNVISAAEAGDPWLITKGGDNFLTPNHANIRPRIVPDAYKYLELYNCWRNQAFGPSSSSSSTDAPESVFTTSPKVRVYGLTQLPAQQLPHWPFNADPEFPDLATQSESGPSGSVDTGLGFWIPLVQDKAITDPTEDHEVELPTSIDAVYESGVNMFVARPAFFPLLGCRRVMALITTVGVIDDNGVGLLIGRFSTGR